MQLIGHLWFLWTVVNTCNGQYQQHHVPFPNNPVNRAPVWGPIVHHVPMMPTYQIPGVNGPRPAGIYSNAPIQVRPIRPPDHLYRPPQVFNDRNFNPNIGFRPVHPNGPASVQTVYAVPNQQRLNSGPPYFNPVHRPPHYPMPVRHQPIQPQFHQQSFYSSPNVQEYRRPSANLPPTQIVPPVYRSPPVFNVNFLPPRQKTSSAISPLPAKVHQTYPLRSNPVPQPTVSETIAERKNYQPSQNSVVSQLEININDPTARAKSTINQPTMKHSYNYFQRPSFAERNIYSSGPIRSSALFGNRPKISIFDSSSTEQPYNTTNEITIDILEVPRELETETSDLDVAESQSLEGFSALFSQCGPNQKCFSPYNCAISGGRRTSNSCGTSSQTFCCVMESHNDNDGKAVNRQPIKSDPQCGWSREKTSRIVGGYDAEFGEYPWQSFIRIGEARCGGALLNRNYVVTAAHCVSGKSNASIEVVLGELILESMVEELPHERRHVAEVIVHPHYRDLAIDAFDVAVLRLDKPVNYQDNIMPICLPDPDENFAGILATVSGWGRLSAENRVKPRHLQAVQLPIIQNTVCQKWLRSRGKYAPIKADHLCAGYEQGGKDACRGDSGGPLAYKKDGRWYLAGLVSAGYSCSKAWLPGIYHRVTNTTGWISEQAFGLSGIELFN